MDGIERCRWTELLTYTIKQCGIDNFTFRISPVKTLTDLGTLAKVQVNGTTNTGTAVTLHWIMKSGPREQVPRINLVGPGRSFHAVEAFSYHTLLPVFRSFQTIDAPFKAYPKLMSWCGQISEEVFIVEDMKQKGYILKDRQKLDLHHLAEVLKTYAHFHAISLAMKDQVPHEFHELYKLHVQSVLGMNDNDRYRGRVEPMSHILFRLLDPVWYMHHWRILTKYTRLYASAIVETAYLGLRDRLSVFCHGESTLCNILFKYGDKTRPNLPTNVCLIDFQMLRYGSPIFDLSYFIFTATDKETRDQHYDDLINIYYRSVCERLREMGSPPEAVFPYDEFQRSLRRFSVLGYFMAQMALYTMLRTPSVNVTVEMTEEDINESFSRDAAESEALYNERIKGMLIDFVEKGYFDFLDVEYSDEDSIETYNETDDEDL